MPRWAAGSARRKARPSSLLVPQGNALPVAVSAGSARFFENATGELWVSLSLSNEGGAVSRGRKGGLKSDFSDFQCFGFSSGFRCLFSDFTGSK